MIKCSVQLQKFLKFQNKILYFGCQFNNWFITRMNYITYFPELNTILYSLQSYFRWVQFRSDFSNNSHSFLSLSRPNVSWITIAYTANTANILSISALGVPKKKGKVRWQSYDIDSVNLVYFYTGWEFTEDTYIPHLCDTAATHACKYFRCVHARHMYRSPNICTAYAQGRLDRRSAKSR